MSKPAYVFPEEQGSGDIETILTLIGTVFSGLALGGMVMFAAVVAPQIFIKLDAANAAKIIRAIFPLYYLYVIVTAGVAAITILTIEFRAAVGLGIAAFCALYALKSLMPRINGAKDQADAGDEEAKRRFDALHKQSVRLNAAGLLGVLYATIMIGLSL